MSTMTMTLAPSTTVPPLRVVGTARLTAGLDQVERLDLAGHEAVHGAPPRHSSDELVTLARDIGLRGRGGAGFPFERKLTAVRAAVSRTGTAPAVVVNATEGEPAAWKDKLLLTRAPHLILDGAVLAANALGASTITIGVADDGVGGASLTEAIRERHMPVPTRVVVMPHRFISGEGGALVRGINGQTPIPPGRKVLTSETGVGGAPTLLSNAETYAQLAIAARLGAARYGRIGDPAEPGTVLLSVGGTAEPTVVEAPTGTRLSVVLRLCRAQPGPVLLGGYHGTWIDATAAAKVRLTRAALAEVGGTLGAGIVLPLGEQTCPLAESSQVAHYLAGQSAGQCGPCRLGVPDLGRALAHLTEGRGGTQAVETVRTAAGAVRGRGACSHPDGTSRFVLSTLDTFAADVAVHLERGGCGRPLLGVLPVPGMTATGPRLQVDWSRCDGHGLCADVAPELIRLDANGYPALPGTAVPEPLLRKARNAVKVCPALALRLATPAAR